LHVATVITPSPSPSTPGTWQQFSPEQPEKHGGGKKTDGGRRTARGGGRNSARRGEGCGEKDQHARKLRGRPGGRPAGRPVGVFTSVAKSDKRRPRRCGPKPNYANRRPAPAGQDNGAPGPLGSLPPPAPSPSRKTGRPPFFRGRLSRY